MFRVKSEITQADFVHVWTLSQQQMLGIIRLSGASVVPHTTRNAPHLIFELFSAAQPISWVGDNKNTAWKIEKG